MVYLFTACTPDFDLNAPYKDVPVVYGILNYQDPVHYVKIYKGFQTNNNGGVFVDAQNPDSIYYYDNIIVVLQEYENNQRTNRPDIPLTITNELHKEDGIFYHGEKSIWYCTKEILDKNKEYKIYITNKLNGNIVEGITPLVGDFNIYSLSSVYDMINASNIAFTKATNAVDYEIHVNFLYYEVDINTNEVVKEGKIVKNICPHVGGDFKFNKDRDYYYKEYSATFFDDIAFQIEPNPNVVRYIGRPDANGRCIEIEGWAAGTDMIKFILSNQTGSSFVQVNDKYTNICAKDGLAFGFLSSRVKCPNREFTTTPSSEDSVCFGSKTYHLGFRPYIEYKP
ncbi:MAG: hypothetical protein FWH59_03325 [Lentimicrobiaceae bacterium]|nr:hypothetical protein [Lentimicrobiaceae bacterium]